MVEPGYLFYEKWLKGKSTVANFDGIAKAGKEPDDILPVNEPILAAVIGP